MKRVQVFSLFSFFVLLLACLVGTVSFGVSEEPRGVVSLVFDDCRRTQYDYAFPLLVERGMKGTFYVITDRIRDFSGLEVYMSLGELHALQDYGCEIGSHGHHHLWLLSLSESAIRAECEVSREILLENGFSAENFAYPYGGRSEYTDSIVDDYYGSGRSAYDNPYLMEVPASGWPLTAVQGETGTPDVLVHLQNVVDQVCSSNGWAIIFFHNILPGANSQSYTISAEDFESFLDYILFMDVPTVTVSEGLSLSGPPAPPPSVSVTPAYDKKYVGQSQTFVSSVSGGNSPFTCQWYLNDTAVLGATDSSWVFTPSSEGYYNVYVEFTDGLGFKVESNVVQVLFCSPYLYLTVNYGQSLVRDQESIVNVLIFNELDPVLESSLTLAVTGPEDYWYFDVQPIRVPAGAVGEYSFSWNVPNASGRCIVEVSLVPALLTAYDVAWLEVS